MTLSSWHLYKAVCARNKFLSPNLFYFPFHLWALSKRAACKLALIFLQFYLSFLVLSLFFLVLSLFWFVFFLILSFYFSSLLFLVFNFCVIFVLVQLVTTSFGVSALHCNCQVDRMASYWMKVPQNLRAPMVPIDEGRELKIEYVFRANTRPWFLKVLYKESTLQFPGTFKDAMASWANNREYPGYIRQSHLQTYFILFVFQKNMNWCNFSDNTDPNCKGFIVKIAKQYLFQWTIVAT